MIEKRRKVKSGSGKYENENNKQTEDKIANNNNNNKRNGGMIQRGMDKNGAKHKKVHSLTMSLTQIGNASAL